MTCTRKQIAMSQQRVEIMELPTHSKYGRQQQPINFRSRKVANKIEVVTGS